MSLLRRAFSVLGALAVSVSVTLPASGTERSFLGKCGTDRQVAGVLLDQEHHEIVALFERYAGTDGEGKPLYLLAYMTARPDGSEWYYLHSDKPLHRAEGDITEQKLCIYETGSRIERLDYETYGDGFENMVPLTVGGKRGEYQQGFINWFMREKAREAWAELERQGQRPGDDRDNPFIVEVLGQRFDHRDVETACRNAQSIWGDRDCETFEQSRYSYAEIGAYIALQALGKDAEDRRYILSIALDDSDDSVHLLYSTLDGGTMRLQTGRSFQFKGWAAAIPGTGAPPLPETTAAIAGHYAVAGVNPNGTVYSGQLEATQLEGNVYRFKWTIGRQVYVGSGAFENGAISIDYGESYPAIYSSNPDGSLTGTWANGKGRETLTPK